MRFIELSIPGAFRIEIDRLPDERGFFARTFCAHEFAARGLVTNFVQQSISFNKNRGTLRGLHYQAVPYAETKLLRCTAGSVFDVIVDIRRSSSTFGRWQAVTISAEDRSMVYIPTGCAHGFQTLTDDTELVYNITPAYAQEAARGIAYNDPELSIAWPLLSPIVSAADRLRPKLAEAEPFA